MRKQVPDTKWHISWMAIFFIASLLGWNQKAALQKVDNQTNKVSAMQMPPQPLISGNGFPCPQAEEIYATPFVAANTYIWTLSSGGVILGQQDASATVLWSDVQGSGPHLLVVEETEPGGASQSDTLKIFIKNIQMACNDTVQVSLDDSGVALVRPDMLLEGNYVSYDGFTVHITDRSNRNLGNKVTCANAQQALKASVINDCDQNSCWSTITIEDKAIPHFLCPTDTLRLECFEDPDTVAFPAVYDNCDRNPIVNLISRKIDTTNTCTGFLIKKTFVATDNRGNTSAPCVQIIEILPPPAPEFPEDITWTCEQFAKFPNIINPTPVHRCIIENAAAMDTSDLYCIPGTDGDDIPGVAPFDSNIAYWTDGEDLDVTLDPNYNDDIDNPFTDPKPNRNDPVTNDPIYSTFGTPSPETDNRADLCNLSLGLCPYFDTLIDTRPHNPDTILTPIYRSGNFVRGLEDADILARTGSGVPNVNTHHCGYAATYKDKRIKACDGADTTVVFKILRTWTLLNWCTGETLSDIQVIKVMDKTPPVVIREPFTVGANLPGNGVHGTCTSTELLLPPFVSDNCTDDWTIRILTPVGEAVYVNGQDGAQGGYIPAPGLPVGIYTVRYIVQDACGNITELEVTVSVVDDEIPIVVCSEFTDISLTIDGTAKVCAETFDEGSFDNCGIDSFFIKRMGEPDLQFRPCIVFDCADDREMVVLRVYDYAGNHNECMIEVRIQDKLRPVCTPPDDVWTTCVEIPDYVNLSDTAVLQNLFGHAVAEDNCTPFLKELAPQIDVNQCGIGTIIRRFQAYDQNGNVAIGTCRQTVMIQERFDYTIYFPADWSGACGDIEDAPDVTFRQGQCDMLAVNSEDLRFNISSDGACYKIIRTWHVMNWCAYDGFSDAIAVPHRVAGDSITEATYDAHGYYEYKQIIKVSDDVAPVVSYDGPVEFCGGYTADCIGDVNILPDIVEDCTVEIHISFRLDAFNDGTFDSDGVGALRRALPLGRHRVVFTVEDGCGNAAGITILFEVKDCKKPTPICINGLSADITQNGNISLRATDFEQGSSSDLCTPYDELKFRINRITDLNGDRQITADDYISSPPPFDTVIFNCFDFGINFVQVWVGDAYDNWDYCVTFIDIQDNMFMCRTGSKLGGKIATEKGEGVADVRVDLNGNRPQYAMTGTDGVFEFSNVEKDYDYTLSPLKDDDPINGVSTFDLVLISKHILRTQVLNSPYKMIAADVNRSGTITTLDIVELRKLILRIEDEFRNNTSWRFVKKDFLFPDPADPFRSPFPEIVNYNDYHREVLDADFIAIKIGDVNGNARTSSLHRVGPRDFRGEISLETTTLDFEAGTKVTLPFKIENAQQLLALQFTLQFDARWLSFEALRPVKGVADYNFGKAKVNQNAITFSWDAFNRTGPSTDALEFEITFTAVQAGSLADALTVNSVFTPAVAWSAVGEVLDVALHFGTGAATQRAFELLQNRPNPFSRTTNIAFQLPEEAAVTLSVFDVNGKIVRQIENTYPKGYNEIEISKENLNGSGIYYYRLETAHHSAGRKMILID